MTRTFIALTAFLTAVTGLLPSPAEAGSGGANGVRVEQAWARASIGTTRPAAAYVTLVNTGNRTAILTGASSPASDKAAVHKTVNDNGMLKMVPAGPITILAGERIEMKPGSYHIMLMKLKRSIDKGSSLRLTLTFTDGTTLDAVGPVMSPGAMGPDK